MTIDISGVVKELQRDRWGRPLITPPGKDKPEPYTRVSTLSKLLDDTSTLTRWKQRLTAGGIATRPDLQALAAAQWAEYRTALQRGDEALERTSKSGLDGTAQQALDAAQASSAANMGTALHSFIEQINRGDDPEIPAQMKPDIDAYREAIKEFDVLRAEQFVVIDDIKAAGTADAVVRHRKSRKVMVADWKSGKWAATLGQRSVAMQLAIYARGVAYHAATGDREPLSIDQDSALLVHLPAGTGRCVLHEVDISPTGAWQGVELALQVRDWRKRQNLLVQAVGMALIDKPAAPKPETPQRKPAAPEGPLPLDHMLALIGRASEIATLELLYRSAVGDHGLKPDDLIPACKERKAAILEARKSRT